jgi:predicted ArsR family transcriptional regulator
MYEDGAFQSLMFGARVRTARMDSIVDEIYRLRDRGQTPNIKDLRFMNSTKVDELREKVGEERFFEITKSYGESLAVKYEEEMKKESYKSLSDEEKKEKLSSVGQKLYVKTLRDNGIKYR